MLAVSACSTLRLGYNQGPTAAYWWLDRYVDFSEAQSPQVRQDLRQFWDWHRREALPVYATRMAQWQNLLAQDLTAEQVCREFDWVQAQLRTLGEQADHVESVSGDGGEQKLVRSHCMPGRLHG